MPPFRCWPRSAEQQPPVCAQRRHAPSLEIVARPTFEGARLSLTVS